MKLPQKVISRPETCEIWRTVDIRTCPDLPRPVQEACPDLSGPVSTCLDLPGPVWTSPGGQVLTANQRKYFFFFQKLHLSFFISRFIIFQSKCIIFNPKTVVPHHKYNFLGGPGPARPGPEGHEGLARPSRDPARGAGALRVSGFRD